MAEALDVRYEAGKSITYNTNGAPREIDLENIIGARKLDGDVWSVIFVGGLPSNSDVKDEEVVKEIKSIQTRELSTEFLELYTIHLTKDTLPEKSRFTLLETDSPALRRFTQQLYADYLSLEVGGRLLSSR
jgi:hypothetical protein